MDRFFSTNLKLGVIGLGKLGAPMLAALASKGFEVFGCDSDESKVRAINEGRAPVDETDLQEFLIANKERIRATTKIKECVQFADITFVVTATPSGPDDKFSLEYILPVCEELGRSLRTKSKQAFHIVVITSTVMPGDTWGPIRETIEKHSGRKCGESFGLAYSPEFIALGSVLRDFLSPDFVLLGASDPLTEARVTSVYKTISDAPIAAMSPVNAEITKIAVNTFLCTKISYANMLLRICNEIPGADVDVVSGAVGMDSRIGKKLLKGGTSYGGPCLPRDTKAMATLGQSFPLVIDSFNRAQILWLADFVQKHAKGVINILGFTYKPGTCEETESAGKALLQELNRRGVRTTRDDNYNVDGDSDTFVVMLPDPAFKDYSFSGSTVIDPWRFLPELANDPSIRYIPLGVGPH
jgi:UDPglucose 6-dehydrogenase